MNDKIHKRNWMLRVFGFLMLSAILFLAIQGGITIHEDLTTPPPQIIRVGIYEPYPDMHLIDSFVGPYNEFFDTVSGDHIMIICKEE